MPPQLWEVKLTLKAIAEILGLDPETILHWILAGRLHVRRQGMRIIILVDAPCTFTSPQPEQILILTKPATAATSWPLTPRSDTR
ncbi:MAG: helix-turn-helix domain-containing protein [Desulfobacca sp.]|uniref:helix-turn-helix domain-containing protein n=1 Tax=Desulfobacca sp. TaxID=2067990 RepID=UPI00404B9429